AYHKGKKNTNAEDWEKFRERLQVPSISKDEARAIGYWTMENLVCHEPSRVQPRALQEFEERIFPAQVHGEFIEAVQFGMVSEMQGENILDEFLETSSLSVRPEKMLSSLSRVWAHNIKLYQSVKVS
ncbi:MAG: hypothetical protein WCR04_12075, partial [Fibrobacteraceae bacterium]